MLKKERKLKCWGDIYIKVGTPRGLGNTKTSAGEANRLTGITLRPGNQSFCSLLTKYIKYEIELIR